MKYPSWDSFVGKNSDDTRHSFEALARFLFREKYHLGDSLPYYKNHPGNETDTVEIDGEVVGFQAKYFEGKIDAKQIKMSVEKAIQYNPKQTKIIIYTNKEFGNPPKGREKTKGQQDIEEFALNAHLKIKWMFGDNVLDLVAKNELAYHIFFDLNSNLWHLPKHIDAANQLYSKTIVDKFLIEDSDCSVDRTEYITRINEIVSSGNNCILMGDSGSGKSVIAKKYFLAHQDDSVFLYLSASQFEFSKINSILGLQKDYDIDDITSYFEDASRKIVILDSVEKITEIRNKLPFKLFVTELNKAGWRFILTIRENYTEQVKNLLEEQDLTDFEYIDIPLLNDKELEDILEKNQRKIPVQPHLYKDLHNLFYLAKYLECTTSANISLTQFRDQIWNIKVRGMGIEDLANQEKREQCFLRMVQTQLEKGNYIIPKENLDYNAVSELIKEGIVAVDGFYGYYIAHDLYTDLALVKLIDRIWHKTQNVKDFFEGLPDDIRHQNAFCKWFSVLLETDSWNLADEFIEQLFEGLSYERYTNAIVASVLSSSNCGKHFFEEYSCELKNNNYKWLSKVLRILMISCQRLHSYVTYNGKQYPLMVPYGSGWNAAIDYVYEHYDLLYSTNGNKIYSLLQGYSFMQSAKQSSRRKAGLMALKPHIYFANLRKRKEYCFFQNPDNHASMVYSYCDSIVDELKNIFNEVIKNAWTNHLDPYFELTDYIVKKQGMGICASLYKSAATEIQTLMKMFWMDENWERPSKSIYANSIGMECEKAWGLNERNCTIHYFPASANQTCIKYLLAYHPVETLKFIIELMNHCVNCYYKSNFYHDNCIMIDTVKLDGTPKKIIGNSTIWNLYRGTSGMATPDLLQCIHMALESFLMTAMEYKNNILVKKCLDEIIDNSNSASLYAIVASVITAYPLEFFDESLILFKNLLFFNLDQTRKTYEINAAPYAFAFNDNKALLEEREKSNALSHRKEDLQDVILTLQLRFDMLDDCVSKQKLQKVYEIIDDLKLQLKNETEEMQSIDSFIVSRIDYRSMEQKEVDVNGVSYLQITPKLTEEQKALSQKTLDNSNLMMQGPLLRMWAKGREMGQKKQYESSLFEKDFHLALSGAKNIKKQLEQRSDGLYILPGDEFVPSLVCATLLRDFQNDLSSEEKSYCVNIVLEALDDIDFMLSSSMTSLVTVFDVLGFVLDYSPDLEKRVLDIFLKYSTQSTTVNNLRCCDIVSIVIDCRKFWECHHEFMQMYISELTKVISANEIDNAEILLSAISVGSCPDNVKEMASQCIFQILLLWKETPNSYDGDFTRRHIDSKLLARYILSSPESEVEKYSCEIGAILYNHKHDTSLLDSFILETIRKHCYSLFWKSWFAMYDEVMKKRKRNLHEEVINSYLLNPFFCKDWGDDWFVIEKRDMKFFSKVALDKGDDSIVLYNLVVVFCTIAKSHWQQSLKILSDLFNRCPGMVLEKDLEVINVMDLLVRNLFSTHKNDIRQVELYRNNVVNILEFMKLHGSKYADSLLKTEF